MRILSIETSCDETAVSLVQADGGLSSPRFTVLGNALYSQIALHAQYGGVYPNLAKREHGLNLVPLLTQTLTEANLLHPFKKNIDILDTTIEHDILTILQREGDLGTATIDFLHTYTKPLIDAIAVTAGPGLEPALWVGISFAQALGVAWNLPVIPTNHMKGHIASVLATNVDNHQPHFPTLSLLISGGHTEFVLSRNWNEYEVIGRTRDDAVGEAFDKVARMLSLPYPGGPQISIRAEYARQHRSTQTPTVTLPRPMIHSHDLDFSFSGLKTAVLYFLRDHSSIPTHELEDDLRNEIAREFEDAVVDVLIAKTKKALDETGSQTLIVAGGVIANTQIRRAFERLIETTYPHISLYIPEKELATDNAIMIACAAYLEIQSQPNLLIRPAEYSPFKADGNMKY